MVSLRRTAQQRRATFPDWDKPAGPIPVAGCERVNSCTRRKVDLQTCRDEVRLTAYRTRAANCDYPCSADFTDGCGPFALPGAAIDG